MRICYKVGNKYFDDENLAVEYEKEYLAKREAENKLKAEKEARKEEIYNAWTKLMEDYGKYKGLCYKYAEDYGYDSLLVNGHIISEFYV